MIEALERLRALRMNRLIPAGKPAGEATADVVVNFDIQEQVARLPESWREAFEERAGIIEFDAHMCRADAEQLALRDILKIMRRDGSAT